MNRIIIVLLGCMTLFALAGCGPILSDTSSESYHYQGPTTTNSVTATGVQTAEQAQNDNRPICAGLFVIGSCNISQANSQVVTTARAKQAAESATTEPDSPDVDAYVSPMWTVLILIGGACWLFLGFLAVSGRLTAGGYNS